MPSPHGRDLGSYKEQRRREEEKVAREMKDDPEKEELFFGTSPTERKELRETGDEQRRIDVDKLNLDALDRERFDAPDKVGRTIRLIDMVMGDSGAFKPVAKPGEKKPTPAGARKPVQATSKPVSPRPGAKAAPTKPAGPRPPAATAKPTAKRGAPLPSSAAPRPAPPRPAPPRPAAPRPAPPKAPPRPAAPRTGPPGPPAPRPAAKPKARPGSAQPPPRPPSSKETKSFKLDDLGLKVQPRKVSGAKKPPRRRSGKPRQR